MNAPAGGRGSNGLRNVTTPIQAFAKKTHAGTEPSGNGAAAASNGIPSMRSDRARPSTGKAAPAVTARSTEPRLCAAGGNETPRPSRSTMRSAAQDRASASASTAAPVLLPGSAAPRRIAAPAAGVNASSSSDAWAGQRHSTWRPKARERRTREPA